MPEEIDTSYRYQPPQRKNSKGKIPYITMFHKEQTTLIKKED